MADDHVVAALVGDDPAALARGIVRHPGMHMGGPVTFERAAAHAMGVEMALIATDRPSPLTQEDTALLMERPDTGRATEQELADIRRLEPILAKVFGALGQLLDAP
ncbi:hypothetical protein UO65_1907 [Actinokineospora spheciospongiae]|uniref:Uncharacterized protein n=1 Tax=Actinokineospora spheciospongiae TaxID=909613 RepID=W7IPI8_9PSEU|nr:hypothetical protein [Actinokineospora spheciospongiae]EWC62785.1 hypothetical protein UO65_1907 [Actinokineospora spheciospongiae]